MALDVGFVPVRKPGKLPFDTLAFHYELEYGSDTLEVHRDGIAPGQNVLLVDDLLATGGTIEACCRLVEHSKAKIAGCAFLIELRGLGGAKRLAPYKPYSLIQYD
jgi:adenine phosphoribosyltransferase